MKKKNIFLVIAIVLLASILVALVGGIFASKIAEANRKNPIVTLDVEGYGKVKIELYPEYAPNTVATIVNLVNNKYYDGKVFHGSEETTLHFGMEKDEKYQENLEKAKQEIKDGKQDVRYPKNVKQDPVMESDLNKKVVAGSDKDKEVTIKGEFVANAFEKNLLRFERGTVGLYRNTYRGYNSPLTQQSYNSGSSLMFVCLQETSPINGLFTGFGKVIEGMEILDEINKLEKLQDETASPDEVKAFVNLPVIKTATVETFGTDYSEVIYQEAFDYNKYLSDEILSQMNKQ